MKLFALSLLFFPLCAVAQTGDDSQRNLERENMLDEVVVTADPKQVGKLNEQPISYDVIEGNSLHKLGGQNRLKDAALFVPNLYMPDYGSALTSAIYIRGIGSRINTPSVGLYVDDVAYIDKSAFDFSLADMQRMEVLRGPQSTLYGRNTMGGLLKVYTHNPLETRNSGKVFNIRFGGATEDASRYVNFYTAHPLGEEGALSLSGFYKGNDGYNRNTYLNRRSNGGESAGGKFRFVYNPMCMKQFTLDFQSGLEYTDEDGYDYYNVGNKQIESNMMGHYRRTLFNSSLRLEGNLKPFIITSITSWQNLNDHMLMDQDFTPADIFTLTQHQKTNTLAEELTLKSHDKQRLQWTIGGRVAKQWLQTNAPVEFGNDGIQSLIQAGVNTGFDKANEAMAPMGMSMAMQINDQSMIVDGIFDTPVFNAAAFAQATLKDMIFNGLDFTLGIRYDYERMRMDYNSGATSHFTFMMTRNGIPMINSPFSATTLYHGRIKNDYDNFLPKAALSYRFNSDNMVYGSVSKGFRSGGYNIQMFGDLIQASLKNEMMRTLAADPTLGRAMEGRVTIEEDPSADATTVYKPEISWNYELGAHLSLLDHHLTAQASVFYIKTSDQQVVRFAGESGLGRQTVNAGKSESYGAEISLNGWCNLFRNILRVNASYGFTHAQFTDYDAGTSKGVIYNYDDNYVPFAPLHNFAVAAEYVIPMRCLNSSHLSIGADLTGSGKVYWTEDNSMSEPLYTLLGAHIGFNWGKASINLWGKNLTGKEYIPFYFESMGKGWAQTSRPRQFGVDVALKF